ncbi:hypothetical protein [Lapillicoccus jejuensis]|uniref:Uncharacterized protein n=1 Tax=Lapillicoccus jejuensis TaxID=402171 RepID=A0A542E2P3_9MICO|nr:hypothetical protein [Lapillicoccus jejuensis]TQJ09602.1 hypothetical protein FB458_2714 [Lapillicoccus jejuensis]
MPVPTPTSRKVVALMALLHTPHTNDDRAPRLRGPVSYDETQGDVGASLFLGGLVVLALLGGLIWLGLF